MRLVHVDEPQHTKEVAFEKAAIILRTRPNAVLFEFPTAPGPSLSHFNRFPPHKKPKDLMEEFKRSNVKDSARYPWLETENVVLEAIEKLWDEGKQVHLYEIDGPIELTSEAEKHIPKGGLVNIAFHYLRELYMHENIRRIEHKLGRDAVAVVLCHNYHWQNLTFLMTEPTTKEIWKHYFGKETKEAVEASLSEKEILTKHWRLKSHFRATP